MNLLETICSFFKSEALDIWSKASAAVQAIFNTIPDDEIAIFHGAQSTFTTALSAGKGWGEAVADTWTYVENQEGAELGKVSNLLLQAFMAKFEAPAKTD